MTTFKAGWRIVFAHKLYLAIYIVWLYAMMVMMSAAVVNNSVHQSDDGIFSEAKASVAVVNRDDTEAGHELASSLRGYFAVSNTVIDLQDRPTVLQNAVATDHVDLIAIVPEGYASDFIKACEQGTAVPKIGTVTSYSSGAGTMGRMEIDSFLSNMRISMTAAKTFDGSGMAKAAKRTVEDKRAAAASGENKVAVVKGDEGKGVVPGLTGFAFAVKLVAYLAFTAVTVIIAVVLSAFGGAERRRRLDVTATSPRRIGLQQILLCVTFSMAVWALYMLVTCCLMAACGMDLRVISAGGYAMVAMAVFSVILVSACFGYLLSAFGMSENAVNGVANVVGLAIMFTSGMAFSVSLMPQAMITIGKLLPGWWYCVSIDKALGVGTASSVDVAGWAYDTGLVLLFGVAFVCLGLGFSRLRSERGE